MAGTPSAAKKSDHRRAAPPEKARREKPLKTKFLLILCWLLPVILIGQTPPKRVISLAPHITEMIFRLDAGALLVGRSDFCLYPPQARAIPNVGGYLNPDLEKIVALQPDVVFIFPNAQLQEKLERLQLRAVAVPNETVEEILGGIERVGKVLHRPQAAAAAVADIRDTLLWVQQQTTRWPRRRVLLLVGREAGSLRQLYAAGKRTYLTELIELCHAENVMADVDLRYFEVSKEDLLHRNPDVILEFRLLEAASDSASVLAGLRSDWQALPTLTAVQQNRVFILTKRYFLIPGPRVAQAAMHLFRLFGGMTP